MSLSPSKLGGKIGDELNRVIAELNRQRMLDTPDASFSVGPAGTRAKVNFPTRSVSGLRLVMAQIGTVSDRSFTAERQDTAEIVTVQRPTNLHSYSDDRESAPNWVPADENVSSEDFHYYGKNSRYRILHGSFDVYVDGGGGDYIAEYAVLSEIIYPIYATNDYVAIFQDDLGQWQEVNMAGRYWKPAIEYKTRYEWDGGFHTLSGADVQLIAMANPHIDSSFVYSNDTPYWIDDTGD